MMAPIFKKILLDTEEGLVRDAALGLKTGIKAGTNITIEDDAGYAKIAASGGGGGATVYSKQLDELWPEPLAGIMYAPEMDDYLQIANFVIDAPKTALVFFTCESSVYADYMVVFYIEVDGTPRTLNFRPMAVLHEPTSGICSYSFAFSLATGTHTIGAWWDEVPAGTTRHSEYARLDVILI